MNNTHLYTLTAFRPAANTTEYRSATTNTTLLRLYAINVAASLDRKFTILWTYDVSIDGVIPYIYSKETFCSTVGSSRGEDPQRRLGSPNGRSRPKFSSDSHFPLSLLTMAAADRLLATIHLEDKESDGGSRSFNLSVRDLGETYSVISSGYSKDSITSISWSNTNTEYWDTPTPTKKKFWNLQGEGSTFWLSSSPPHEDMSVLEQRTELAGPPPQGSSLTLSTLLTTPITLLHTASTARDSLKVLSPLELLVFGSSGGVSHDSPTPECEWGNEKRLGDKGVEKESRGSGGGGACISESQPHLVGVATEGGGGGGGSEGRVEGPSVVWSVPLPRSQPAQGQISSLSLSPNPLLFVTTPLGVYAYTL